MYLAWWTDIHRARFSPVNVGRSSNKLMCKTRCTFMSEVWSRNGELMSFTVWCFSGVAASSLENSVVTSNWRCVDVRTEHTQTKNITWTFTHRRGKCQYSCTLGLPSLLSFFSWHCSHSIPIQHGDFYPPQPCTEGHGRVCQAQNNAAALALSLVLSVTAALWTVCSLNISNSTCASSNEWRWF